MVDSKLTMLGPLDFLLSLRVVIMSLDSKQIILKTGRFHV